MDEAFTEPLNDPIELRNKFGGPSRSQKKKQKKHGDMRKQLFAAIGIVNVLYLLAPFTLYSEEVEFPWKLFAMHTVLSAYFTRLVLNSVLSGYDYEYYFDILVINLFTQAMATYSDNAYYLFLLPPAFLAYKLLRRVVNWVFTPTAAEIEEDQQVKAAEQKKAKQKNRRKIKRVR